MRESASGVNDVDGAIFRWCEVFRGLGLAAPFGEHTGANGLGEVVVEGVGDTRSVAECVGEIVCIPCDVFLAGSSIEASIV